LSFVYFYNSFYNFRCIDKVSIYYDTTEVIQKDDRAAHGIPVISGISELTNWFHDFYTIQEKSIK
jgi:hypothetical protein